MRRPKLPPGPHPETKSHSALVAWCTKHSQVELEERSGVPQPRISDYILRRSRPNLADAQKLAAVIRACTPAGWLPDEEHTASRAARPATAGAA